MLHSTTGVTPAGARVPEYVMPKNDILSGDWKSHVWRGPAHYIPSERRWIAYHNYRCLPLLAKRDAKDLQSETEYVDFIRSVDTPSGIRYRNIGLLPCKHPELKIFGYKKEASTLPCREFTCWPLSPDVKCYHDPYLIHKGEYGYYHDVLDSSAFRLRKDVPANLKIDACDVPNYGHIPNFLYGRSTFAEHIEQNNPMYNNTFCTGISRTHHVDQPDE